MTEVSTVVKVMTTPNESDKPSLFLEFGDGPFAGVKVQPEPKQLVTNRADLRYRASDIDDRGDLLIIDEVPYTIHPKAFKSLVRLVSLKSNTWYLGNFEAPTREKMFHELVDELGGKDLRVFYKETDGNPRVMNVVEADKPILTDVEMLDIASQVAGEDGIGIKVKMAKYTEGGLVMQFYYENGYDLTEAFENVGTENALPPDVNYFGATIKNSQLGFHSPSCDGYAFRPSCSNGATTSQGVDAWSKKDRDEAMSVNDLKEWYRTELQHILSSQEALAAKAKAALQTKATGGLLNEVAVENKISGKMLKAVYDSYLKEPGIRQWEDGTSEPSVFAISQAFTRAAHAGDFDDVTRERLEQIGGELIYR